MKILSRPKGNAEEYGRWSVNPYVGCPHECSYCYLKKGVWSKTLGGNTPKLKTGLVNQEHAYFLAMAEIIKHQDEIIRDGGLFMSFTTDPLTSDTEWLFSKIANSCGIRNIPVIVLTKSTAFMNTQYCDMFHYAAIGFTLTGHDELEPHAAPNDFRIDAMAELSKRGKITWASIEPVIDFDSSYQMIQQAVDAGCRHFKIGLLTSNTRVCRDKYDMAECCQFVGYVMDATDGRATVYWKQSFYDYFGSEPIHGMTADEFFHQWNHSVDKDFNMFNVNAEF